MELKTSPRDWLIDNRLQVSLVALSLLLLLGTVWWGSTRRTDITNEMSRANCRRLYQQAKTHAESVAVDARVASVPMERKNGLLRPDVRCGEVRVYDSVTVRE